MKDPISDKERLRLLYRRVFMTPEGAEVLGDILRRNHALGIVASTDLNYSAILEGQRRAALSILYLVHPNPLDIICEKTHSSSTPIKTLAEAVAETNPP